MYLSLSLYIYIHKLKIIMIIITIWVQVIISTTTLLRLYTLCTLPILLVAFKKLTFQVNINESKYMPNLPTNIARVKLSGRIPRKSLGAWEFHPLKLRLCSSQAL